MTQIEHITLFTTALCNLNCNYCYICKDVAGGLKQIDNDLKHDFENNNQIKQVLDYDSETAEKIKGITLWGGEPFLHLERFTDNIDTYFKAFKSLNKIDTSTNFTIPNQAKKIEDLLHHIDRNYHGKDRFTFDLQISIDGYEEMNDYGRGEGVTKAFLQNFYDLLKIEYNYDKIQFICHTKATLSKETFKFLKGKENIEKWFKFFDKKMFLPYKASGSPFEFFVCLWNCAQPTEWTSEDGKEYAQIIKDIAEITPVIKKKYPSWGRIPSLVPEAQSTCDLLIKTDIEQIIQNYACPRCESGCGSFIYNIVPIPHNLFTMCHRGLFDAYIDYTNNFKNKENMNNLSKAFFQAKNFNDWIYTKQELKTMEKTMSDLVRSSNQIRYTDLVITIREYAIAGIIDGKYRDIKEIDKTLGYFLNNSYCLQDAYIFNGSWTTPCAIEIPLLYNGVMDVVAEEIERVRGENGWKIN